MQKIHKPPTKARTRKTKRTKQPKATNKEKVEEKPRKESGRKKRKKHRRKGNQNAKPTGDLLTRKRISCQRKWEINQGGNDKSMERRTEENREI